MNCLPNIAASLGLLIACGFGPARADDWQDFNDRLTTAGITPALTYQGGAAANLSGGEKRGATYTNNLHVQLTFDGETLAGMPGLTAHLDGLWVGGGQPSKFAGDAQGVSSIAASDAVRLYEAWLQYNFPGNDVSILAGRYDLNSEFDHLASAGLFFNSSFGISPEFSHTGFAGPSIFPNTSVGIRLAYKPTVNTVLRAAILDGAPLDQQNGSPDPFSPRDGVLLITEAAWRTRPAPSGDTPDQGFQIGRRGTPFAYDDKIAIGAWYYTARFNALGATNAAGNPTQHRGEGGAYLLLDHLLFQSADDPNRRLTGFIQVGVADPVVGRFGTYVGAGLTLAAVLPNRPADQLGLAVAMARNGSSYIAGQQQAAMPVNAAETAIELSYLVQATTSIAIQPDIQYVIHPNTDPRLRNATIAQVRLELTY